MVGLNGLDALRKAAIDQATDKVADDRTAKQILSDLVQQQSKEKLTRSEMPSSARLLFRVVEVDTDLDMDRVAALEKMGVKELQDQCEAVGIVIKDKSRWLKVAEMARLLVEKAQKGQKESSENVVDMSSDATDAVAVDMSNQPTAVDVDMPSDEAKDVNKLVDDANSANFGDINTPANEATVQVERTTRSRKRVRYPPHLVETQLTPDRSDRSPCWPAR